MLKPGQKDPDAHQGEEGEVARKQRNQEQRGPGDEQLQALPGWTGVWSIARLVV